MYDAIYAGADVRAIVKARYPDGHFEDASDDIHPERFSVEIAGCDEKQYWRFLIEEGIALASLNVGLAMRIPGKVQDELLALLAEMKAAREER